MSDHAENVYVFADAPRLLTPEDGPVLVRLFNELIEAAWPEDSLAEWASFSFDAREGDWSLQLSDPYNDERQMRLEQGDLRERRFPTLVEALRAMLQEYRDFERETASDPGKDVTP